MNLIRLLGFKVLHKSVSEIYKMNKKTLTYHLQQISKHCLVAQS